MKPKKKQKIDLDQLRTELKLFFLHYILYQTKLILNQI